MDIYFYLWYDGTQGRLPQNMLIWHIDYFKLKLLEKPPVQGHSDPFLRLPESRKQISHVKGALSASGGRKTSLPSETGNSGPRRLCEQNSAYFFH